MKRTFSLILSATALSVATADVPLRWNVETSRLQPAVFDAVRGETLALEATFQSYGKPLAMPQDCRLFWQTNGMDSAWWTSPATTVSNRVTVSFTPAMDPGGSTVSCYLGATGSIYRAAFTLRFRNGPGALPNAIVFPPKVLDLAHTVVVNPAWPTKEDFKNATNDLEAVLKDYVDEQIAGAGTISPQVATNISEGVTRSVVTKAYVEDLGISSQETDPFYNADKTNLYTKTQADATFYPKANGNQLASQVANLGAHLNAEDAQVVVTNYDSVTRIPEMSLKIKLASGNTNTWRTIWEEMTRWNAFTGTNFNWSTWIGFKSWMTSVNSSLAAASPKEYAFYDGVTGEVAPDGFFWISQPRVAVCAGAAYQRYVEGANAVWLLESNGLVADINGTTNGYFRITDEEGNTHFEIVKGNKRTVYANANCLTRTNVLGVTHWYSTYSVTNAVSAPTARFTRSLSNPSWKADSAQDCPCNVVWTPGYNCYHLEFWPKGNEPTMFVKADYERGGETLIRQSVPVEMQYIILNGTKYSLSVKTVSGQTVLGLTEVN